MEHLLVISEQRLGEPLNKVNPYIKSVLIKEGYQKAFYHNKQVPCFQLTIQQETIFAYTNYFIGVDWLEIEKVAVYVEPKLNEAEQVNFMGMLIKSLASRENFDHLDGLFHVEYDEPWITIPEQLDLLSPLLIVQFLKIVQQIVRKGIKKSYYNVTENLNSRVKGKILVSRQIRENVIKNRFTKTICNYQEYGINTRENQFIKLVLEFVSSYLSQKQHLFNNQQNLELKNLLYYCQPAFEQVDLPREKHMRFHSHTNVFYKEYRDVMKIGSYILKRFSFNISKTSQSQTTTPPFWIDMSKLFELYVFEKLRQAFPEPGTITYHDRFAGGKETDILIRRGEYKCVVDCKYKPHIKEGNPSLEDKRQVVGYTRLVSVYNKLEITKDKLIKALIIYSHQDCNENIERENLFKEKVDEYVEFYKYGIRLPELSI